MSAETTATPVVTITVTKENFEAGLNGEVLTDEQWASIADDIQGRLENYLDEGLLADITEDFNEGVYEV